MTVIKSKPDIQSIALWNVESLVYYKVRWTVSTVIANCDSFFYYKVGHGLLQVATDITKCDGFITNCDRYYKVR